MGTAGQIWVGGGPSKNRSGVLEKGPTWGGTRRVKIVLITRLVTRRQDLTLGGRDDEVLPYRN